MDATAGPQIRRRRGDYYRSVFELRLLTRSDVLDFLQGLVAEIPKLRSH